jgi:hypothetical protein
MIDIGKILKRAWHVLWNYKVLWIFGILLALTAGGGSLSNGGSPGYRFDANDRFNGSQGADPGFQTGEGWRELNDWFVQNVNPVFDHPDQYESTLIWIGIGFIAFILVLSVIGAFIRYVSETAVLRMVDEHEQTGTRLGFKQGWKLGWTKRAFRLWLIDLVISLPAILMVLILLAAGILLFVSFEDGSRYAVFAGLATATLCAALFFIAFNVLMVFVGLLRQFFSRAAALEGASLGDSFRSGWKTFKANWKSAALMWLVMLGIGIGFWITRLIVSILLIPVYLLTGLAGLLVAAIPGAIAYFITSLFAPSLAAWVVAGAVALPFFLLLTLSPVTLLTGLYLVFNSTVWTLTYREMKALESLQPQAVEALPLPPAS